MPPRMHQKLSYRAGRVLVCALLVATLPFPAAAGEDPATPLPGSRTYVTNVTFVAFDTETTGFDPVKDRIVEIGAVKFRNGAVVEQASWLVNPGRTIPYWARRVHGITDEMVAEQPGFKAVYAEFSSFIEGSVLMAHNARFDVAFLNEETRRNQCQPPPNEVIDTLALFRAWFPESEKYSLEALSDHLQLSSREFHRALADSMYIFRILEVGLEDHSHLKTLGSLRRASGGTLRF